MLALSRSRNESIFIGSDIVVTVLGIRVGETWISQANVRLSFQAPRDVSIFREEVAAREHGGAGGRSRRKQPHHRSGYLTDIPGATVRLRLRVPEEFDVPIYRDRLPRDRSQAHRRIEVLRPNQPSDSETDPSPGFERSKNPVDHAALSRCSSFGSPAATVDLECIEGESILIGKDMVITVAAVRRFVPSPQ